MAQFKVVGWGNKDDADREKLQELAGNLGFKLSRRGRIPPEVELEKITAFKDGLVGKFVIPITVAPAS